MMLLLRHADTTPCFRCCWRRLLPYYASFISDDAHYAAAFAYFLSLAFARHFISLRYAPFRCCRHDCWYVTLTRLILFAGARYDITFAYGYITHAAGLLLLLIDAAALIRLAATRHYDAAMPPLRYACYADCQYLLAGYWCCRDTPLVVFLAATLDITLLSQEYIRWDYYATDITLPPCRRDRRHDDIIAAAIRQLFHCCQPRHYVDTADDTYWYITRH